MFFFLQIRVIRKLDSNFLLVGIQAKHTVIHWNINIQIMSESKYKVLRIIIRGYNQLTSRNNKQKSRDEQKKRRIKMRTEEICNQFAILKNVNNIVYWSCRVLITPFFSFYFVFCARLGYELLLTIHIVHAQQLSHKKQFSY